MSTLDTELWVPWIDVTALPQIEVEPGVFEDDPRSMPPIIGISHIWKADVPHGIEKKVADGALDDQAAKDGTMASTHAQIMVTKTDAPSVMAAVPYASVPYETRLLISMNNQCKADWEGETMGFVDAIPNIGSISAADKGMVKRLLAQARARGLPKKESDAIISKWDLNSQIGP